MSSVCDFSTGSLTPMLPSRSNKALEVLGPVRNRLRQSDYLPLRRIECRYEAGTISLYGRVASFYLKQMAQEIAGDGKVGVANYIEVDA